ncbi:unnamed protein product [Rotaria magnacalcarata]|uniref:F-box domain-containing protein n=1 Tax=Rotaria magnacalcarata TaxID=392030 RepID=A0A820C2U8_9BILA|nr:unnamed protein product [Rotaria magnacalcarata]CAF4215690.1 unnamed protein product [Rotaria magnacalcarata]
MTLTFESLPNEIWLSIFTYLPSRHIWRAFFGINRRLNQLLTSDLIRHTIDLKDISYSEIVELLDERDNNNSHDHRWQAEFVSHAHAICLENKFDYEILIDRWIATKTNWKLSSLRIIYILPEAITSIYIYSLLRELKFTIFLESQLHYLHLVFDDPCYTYHSILSEIVEKRISYPIMILEVTRGHQYQRWERREDLYNIKHPLHWIHTVRLTLSLQHSSELILLFMPAALPLLEHLNVTIEQPRKDLISKSGQSTERFELCEKDLRCTTATATKLRSFVLRQIELDDLLILFNTLSFPLLHTLTLVDIHDKSLDNLLAFQQSVSPTNLPSLKHDQFQFLLRFPAEYEHEWIHRYHNNGWPFDNVSFHVDEHLVEQLSYSSPLDIIEAVFIVYSVPSDILKHMRTVHNYELFTRHSTIIRKDFVCQNMEWLCKWTNNEIQLITSLKTMRNIEALRCFCVGINNQPEIFITPTHANLCHHLRSLTFRFKQHVSYQSSTHYSPLQIILDVSPHLSYLNVRWRDLSHCSGRYPMITHVHLTIYGWERRDFSASRLSIFIPKVHYLAIGGEHLIREKQMVDFVLELLIDKAHFRELILLQINKNGNARLKPHVKANTKQAIIEKIDRLQDSTMTQIEFSYHNQLSIWLC